MNLHTKIQSIYVLWDSGQKIDAVKETKQWLGVDIKAAHNACKERDIAALHDKVVSYLHGEIEKLQARLESVDLERSY